MSSNNSITNSKKINSRNNGLNNIKKISSYMNQSILHLNKKPNYITICEEMISLIKTIEGQPITIFSISTGDAKLELYIIYYIINIYYDDPRFIDKDILLYIYDPVYYDTCNNNYNIKLKYILDKISNSRLKSNGSKINILCNFELINHSIENRLNNTEYENYKIQFLGFHDLIYNQLEDFPRNIGLIISCNMSLSIGKKYYKDKPLMTPDKNNIERWVKISKLYELINSKFKTRLFNLLKSKCIEGTPFYFSNEFFYILPIIDELESFKHLSEILKSSSKRISMIPIDEV